MKSKIKKEHVLYEPVFSSRLSIRWVTYVGKDHQGEVEAKYDRDGKYYILKLTKLSSWCVAHECIHIVAEMLNDCGISTNLKSVSIQEVFAYYHGYWLCEIEKVIRNWEKEIKKPKD